MNGDEIRSGFRVTSARKQLWQIELGILNVVDEICENNQLRYYLIGGSAIGAVRHGGFVPWDDDLDLGMLRSDFERFVELFDKENHSRYVMQYGAGLDNKTPGTFLRIRDPKTTGIIARQRNRKDFVHGVFIEIYIFDAVPISERKRNIQRILSAILKETLEERFDHRKANGKIRWITPMLRFVNTATLWRMWNKVCRHYEKKGTGLVDTVTMPQYMKNRLGQYKEDWFRDSVAVPFENQTAKVAIQNDEYLRCTYGDYMKLPPVELRGSHHNAVVFYDPYHAPEYYLDSDIPARYFAGESDLSII